MSIAPSRTIPIRLLAAAVAAWALLPSALAKEAAPPEPDALQTAARLVALSGAPGGICTVVGARDARLALALARQGRFAVHCLAATPQLRDQMRAAIRAQGMYGTVSAHTLRGDRLPYADNLLNIAVIASCPALEKAGLTAAEAVRVLAPLGTACFGTSAPSAASKAWAAGLMARLRGAGIKELSLVEEGGTWVRVRKPWPPDIDEWTHYLHGADGNPVARDRVVGPPKHYQWISNPMWLRSHETDSSISTLVTARGRLFAIIDEAPISLAGNHPLPDKWFLVARDAFNGVLLWKVPIRRWGWREWKHSWFNTRPGDIPLNIHSRLVAAGDKVYVTLGYRAPISQLDARTGEILKTYADTEGTGEVLFLNGTLVLSLVGDEGVKVMALDADTGKRLWVTQKAYGGTTVDYIRWRAMRGSTKPAKLDPSLNIATDGTVVALIDGTHIACLDFRTGAEKWRAPFPLDPADHGTGGIRGKGVLWNGTMIVSNGVVVHSSPHKLAGLDAATGKLLWSQPKKYIGHLWYEWKDVFVIDRLVWTWSADLGRGEFDIGRTRKQRTVYPKTVNGYDIKTGKLAKSVSLGTIFKAHHHHRCYRNKATSRYILASRRGTEFVDLEDGKHTVHNWVRGACHLGMMPANGLQYAPPHPCACYINEKLNGMMALAHAREGRGSGVEGRVEESTRLQKGPAYGALAPRPSSLDTPSDWPAFRHDAMRTGSVATTVPDDAAPLWRVKLGSKLSAPIAVADRVFAALVDEHHVVCLDARDGRTLWEFAAGGRIDSPPTWHHGTVLFGSADGSVYCLRAADGQLVWRFRAAPAQRLMAAFGQLESAWPVHGSVLVQKGIAYFAAGRTSQLDGGIHLYGLDAATGKRLHHTNLHGPDYKVGDFDANFRLPMGCLPDVLMGDGAKVYMRTEVFNARLERDKGGTELRTRSGFLDDNYFKRVPWTFGKGGYGRLIVHDKRSVYYVRMFDSLRGLDPTVYFTPGRQGYLLFARNVDGKRNTWMERVKIRIRAMVLATGRLFVAGPPDVVDPKDPLGSFEGRQGGLLTVIDTAAGKKVAEHVLPSPPVFNGAAAARGRLYLAAEDGTLTCFGRRH